MSPVSIAEEEEAEAAAEEVAAWRATHAPHYSYAALASESLVPFPTPPPLPPLLRHTKAKKASTIAEEGAWLGD